MDGFTSLSFTQTILVWTLLGLLLIWMVTFAVLAFRSDTLNHVNSVNQEDEPTSAQSFMAMTDSTIAHTNGIANSYQLVPRKIETEIHSTSGEMGTVRA